MVKNQKKIVYNLKDIIQTLFSKKYDDKFKMSKILENKKARGYNRDINMKIKSNENEKRNIQKYIKYNKEEIELKKNEKLFELKNMYKIKLIEYRKNKVGLSSGEKSLSRDFKDDLDYKIKKIKKKIKSINRQNKNMKELEKKRKEKDLFIKQKEFEAKKEIEFNEMKNKSELVEKIITMFKNISINS